MKKFNFFPVAVIGIMILAAIAAVMIFSGFLPGYKNKGGRKGPDVKLAMWGTLPKEEISPAISTLNKENNDFFTIEYSQKSLAAYEEDLIRALAVDKGPDFLILEQDEILKNKDKIFAITFTSYPQRTYLDNFVDAGELFLDGGGQGITGIPFLIDPMVLYWNKDMFGSAGVSQPAKDWDEFVRQAALFTGKNDAGNIEQTGAALGEFTNVLSAKDILAMMMFQAGDPIVKYDGRGKLRAALEQGKGKQLSPAESSVKFFSEFSNPNKTNYSWNKALPKSDAMFARGALAMYFGYAGEYAGIRAKNPHLNFDIAEVPQIKDSGIKISFGKVYALAILKNSPKKQDSFSAITKLTDKRASKMFSLSSGLASPRRDVLSENASDAYFALINKAAIMSRGWLDPDAGQTYLIFKDMVESSASGAVTISNAAQTAKRKLDQLLKQMETGDN